MKVRSEGGAKTEKWKKSENLKPEDFRFEERRDREKVPSSKSKIPIQSQEPKVQSQRPKSKAGGWGSLAPGMSAGDDSGVVGRRGL